METRIQLLFYLVVLRAFFGCLLILFKYIFIINIIYVEVLLFRDTRLWQPQDVGVDVDSIASCYRGRQRVFVFWFSIYLSG